MKEKVYRVTVVLDVYGQTSKAGVTDWLYEACEVDGMILVKQSKPELLPDEGSAK